MMQKKSGRDHKGRFTKDNTVNLSHGLYSYLKSKRIPSNIEGADKIEALLPQIYEKMIIRQGGMDVIFPEEIILINETVEAIGVRMLVYEACKKFGVFNPSSLKSKLIELQPALGHSFVAYSNLIRLNLLALRELRKERAKGSPMTAEKIIELVESEKRGKK